MFERFTDRAKKVMALANQWSQRFNHEFVGTEHILLGLVKEGSGIGVSVLRSKGLDLPKIQAEVEKLIKNGPDIVAMGKAPMTPHAKQAIQYAIEECRTLGQHFVGTEHLILGLLREKDGVAARVLVSMGLTLEAAREEAIKMLQRSQNKEGAIAVGQEAPDFELDNQDKVKVKLSSFRGKKKVVLAFYPLDFSPVCTKEHECLVKDLPGISDKDAVVLGISVDSVWCHKAFREAKGITYDLLADIHRKVVKQYDLFSPEGNVGRRATVIVDRAGKVAWFKEQPMREGRDDAEIIAALEKTE